MSPRPGRTDSLHDVAGLRVGHDQATTAGYLTGCTVVLAGADTVAGVDVRGGGPATRETDALAPQNLIETIHAVLLTGGSAYGLAAADGVMGELETAGRGFAVAPEVVVPIVPTAALFDLGRGGDPRRRPDAGFGARATAAALADAAEAAPARPATGNVGAGTGAVAGGLKGGIGTASAVTPEGFTVAALVAVNAAGSPVHPNSGRLLGDLAAADGPVLGEPKAGDLHRYRQQRSDAAVAFAGPHRATTIGVVATDAVLGRPRCGKLAGAGHDGLARAINPVHTLSDGDTMFGLATGTAAREPDPLECFGLLAAAGDVVTRAVLEALLSAESVSAEGDRQAIGCYRDVFSTAFPAP